MNRTWAVVIGIVIAVVIVGSIAAVLLLTPPVGEARVRVVHASPDAPAVDVWVNDEIAFEDIAFEEITGYAALQAGSYNVKVVPAGATEPVVIDANLDLAMDTDYTVVAVGKLADIEPLVLVDNVGVDEDAHVRFVHASPDAPAVDIAVQGGPVLFADIEFKEVGAFIDVAPGSYRLEVRLAGTDTVVLELGSATFEGEEVYTVYAMGLAGDGTLTAVGVETVQEARVRVIHASPDAPSVDVLVDDAPAFEDVAFQEVTAYAWLPVGTYNVKVVPAGATTPVVIEANLTLDAFVEYSVVAVGLLATIEPLVLVDADDPVDTSDASIRFVHASPDAPAVDIAVQGGPVLFADVELKEIGDYLEVAAGSYDLEVRLAGTSTVVLDLPGIALSGGTTYSVYAMGLAGSGTLTAVLTTDA